jgi:DNA-binding transcriptional MerR regulator
MPELSSRIEIPNRALFKAAEVCDILQVQPYVLRSWEAEFPDIGVAKAGGGPRVYRRADVEQVARIKHLLLVEGLTLAGARRRLEEEAMPVAADVPRIDELIGRHARERLTDVKRGLQSILDLLTGAPGGAERPVARVASKSSGSRPVVKRRKLSSASSRGRVSARGRRRR